MNNFSGDCVDVKMLPREWYHRMVDVCGVGVFDKRQWRDVFITHLDSDHLPLKEAIAGAKIKFYVARGLVPAIQKAYGDAFEVVEYTDVLKLKHTTLTFRARGMKFVEKATYAYFIHDAVVLPESDNIDRLVEEYKPKFTFLFTAYQSHSHPVNFNNHRRDVFILHNKVWKPYAPNIVPKIVFSCSTDDRALYDRYVPRTLFDAKNT